MLFLSCFCYAFVCVFLVMPCGHMLGKQGLWFVFVMSNCKVIIFPLVSWVRCGAWLYRFLIFALFLFFYTTFILRMVFFFN